MKSKSLIVCAALSFSAFFALQGDLSAEEPPAKPAPGKVAEGSRGLLIAFHNASETGDLAGMKAAYAGLRASDPESDRLPGLAFRIAMAEKDWPGVKQGLENMPAGELYDIDLGEALRSIAMGGWEGAPKELFGTVAEKTEVLMLAENPDNPATMGDQLLLCSVHWHAENREKARDYARKAVQLAEKSKESPEVRGAAERFLKQVEGGRLPSMMEFMLWVQGVVPEDSNETPAADQKFDAAAHIGKSIDIKFTAADGTEVDLAKLKGKVVLIDFWATWCGPCVAEIPQMKEVYQKYHDKGFEIIGISFEGTNGKERMLEFVKNRNMPWPQYYDGKHWNNAFGRRFSIKSLPTLWLIDKEGKLSDTDARGELEEKVKKLLGV